MSRSAPGGTGRSDKPFYDLVGFAKLFLRTHSVRTHKDIRTELLAEAFRLHMGLSPFPSLLQLQQLCRDLTIELGDLPRGSPMPGANTSVGSRHALYVRPDLPTWFAESTVCHELREIIEHAFQYAEPSYVGLDTSDNKEMHGESEYFVLCLLMQSEATHKRLEEIGFDCVRFVVEQGRSLPSVMLRAQAVYGGRDPRPGPYAGLWLFDGPSKGAVSASSLKVKNAVSLGGFTRDKSGSEYAKRANAAFPSRGTSGEEVDVVREALARGRSVLAAVSLRDLFDGENYTVVAEPIIANGQPRRVVMTAIRQDCLPMVEPLLRRLDV